MGINLKRIAAAILLLVATQGARAEGLQKILGLSASDKGIVLVGTNDFTLYTFDKDVVGSGASACNGQCAVIWMAAVVELESVAAPLSLVVRDDGKKQLAYNGKPLYFYSKDLQPGDILGDNVFNVWHLALLQVP